MFIQKTKYVTYEFGEALPDKLPTDLRFAFPGWVSVMACAAWRAVE